MKTYVLPVAKETCSYLQRLGIEVDGKANIIDRMISNHKDDNDGGVSVLTSDIFNAYQGQYNEIFAEWTIAKDQLTAVLGKEVIEKEGKEDVNWEWKITDFNSGEAEIKIRD